MFGASEEPVNKVPVCLIFSAVLVCLVASPATARDLTFEDRVQAQEAIERVYYSHQVGATKPFESAVPRSVLEAKVRNYLKQSVALEQYWNKPLTASMLRAEAERISRASRMPERLRELDAALGHDSFLVQECLVRPALVDRLARSLFAFDRRIHARARRQAESLLGDLARGRETPPTARHRAPGAAASIREEPDEFVVRLGNDDGEQALGNVSRVVKKQSWQNWWEAESARFDPGLARPVAISSAALPAVAEGAGVLFGATEGNESPASGFLEPGLACARNDTWYTGALAQVADVQDGSTAVWTGTLMLVWGGGHCGGYVNTGFRYDPITDTWTPMSVVGAPSPRYAHSGVWDGHSMSIWGGYIFNGTESVRFGDGARYDPVTDTWTPMATAGAPSPRCGHAAVWSGSVMVVWGGDGDDDVPLNSGARYDPETDSWTPMATGPAGRDDFTAVWSGREMLVWGGEARGSQGEYRYPEGGRYDPQLDVWRPINGPPGGSFRAGHSAVWTGSEMVVWGGWFIEPFPSGRFHRLQTGARYDPSTGAWTAIQNSGAPSARSLHTAVWTGESMVVWGGIDASGEPTSGGRYDPGTDTWSPTSEDNAPAGRYSHTAIWTGDAMVVWGGVDTPAGGRYDPATDRWTPIVTSGPPTPRLGHSALWTGSLMLVWAGASINDDVLNSGAKYDPAMDAWTPITPSGAPGPSYGQGAVWSGQEMLVWGGFLVDSLNDPSVLFDTGSRYDPETDRWTPMTTVGAPTARYWFATVWTGEQMLIWGGEDASGLTNTGGRYDPSSDTWVPMSVVDAPASRYLHTAVWTGSRMVIWGGRDSTSLAITGGRYDPSTDTWLPTSTDNAPTGRLDATAVWTGNQLIVWGGRDVSFDMLGTGGRYDPTADSWTAIATAEAPSSRIDPVSVWTGSRMLVWSGFDEDGFTNDGAQYDPSNDTWKAISTQNAPAPRRDPSAVWTGNAMIIWGGQGTRCLLGDGGLYGVVDAAHDYDSDGYSDTCETGAWLADLNNSGRVDAFDLVLMAWSWGTRCGDERYDARADLDREGTSACWIEGSDLSILASSWGKTAGAR